MPKRIKSNEIYENRFYRIPKAFFMTEKYKGMSLEAKVIYGFLDDRRELSLKNNWINENDEIYLIFTRLEIQEMLCLSDKTVSKAFKQLREYGLIQEDRQGINKPNLIYVCHINFENIEEMRIRKISDSRTGNNPCQESEEIRGNDTEYNKTNLNKTENIYIDLPIDDNYFLKIYNYFFYKKFGKNHMKVSQEQLNYIEENIERLKDNDIYDSLFAEVVEDYFNDLASGNNGNILSFIKGFRRHFDINPTDYE